MASYQKDKRDLLNRLRRLEGQVRGVQRMIEEDKYCVDVLIQLSSIMAASQRVGMIILQDHIQGCVRDALTQDQNSQAAVEELLEVIRRFSRA